MKFKNATGVNHELHRKSNKKNMSSGPCIMKQNKYTYATANVKEKLNRKQWKPREHTMNPNSAFRGGANNEML